MVIDDLEQGFYTLEILYCDLVHVCMCEGMRGGCMCVGRRRHVCMFVCMRGFLYLLSLSLSPVLMAAPSLASRQRVVFHLLQLDVKQVCYLLHHRPFPHPHSPHLHHQSHPPKNSASFWPRTLKLVTSVSLLLRSLSLHNEPQSLFYFPSAQ